MGGIFLVLSCFFMAQESNINVGPICTVTLVPFQDELKPCHYRPLLTPDKARCVFIKFTVLHGFLHFEYDAVLIRVLLPEESLQVLSHVVAVGGVDLIVKLRIFAR